MAEKSEARVRIAPLQRVTATPITDPSAQATLDEQRKRVATVPAAFGARDGVPPGEAGEVGRVLALCLRLMPDERAALLSRFIARLPSDEQRGLLERLLAGVSAENLRLLEQQLRESIDTCPA